MWKMGEVVLVGSKSVVYLFVDYPRKGRERYKKEPSVLEKIYIEPPSPHPLG